MSCCYARTGLWAKSGQCLLLSIKFYWHSASHIHWLAWCSQEFMHDSEQSGALATETRWPENPKIFPLWFFPEKDCETPVVDHTQIFPPSSLSHPPAPLAISQWSDQWAMPSLQSTVHLLNAESGGMDVWLVLDCFVKNSITEETVISPFVNCYEPRVT